MKLKAATTFALSVFGFYFLSLSNAADTLIAGDVLRNWQTLKSRNKFFQFGFFNPSVHSINRYLAIRCMDVGNMNKLVWVANRENPLIDTSGYLNLTRDGQLVISNESGTSFTVNSGESKTLSNTSLTLLNSGNLVLKSDQRVVWQSFDHPTDTILPGMKFGLLDKKSQTQRQILTSWLSPEVPSAGEFTLGIDLNGKRKLEIRRKGNYYWRSQVWNETGDDIFNFPEDLYIKVNYTWNENESYFSYTLTKFSYSWIEIDSNGRILRLYGDKYYYYYYYTVACTLGMELHSEGCVETKCSRGNEFKSVFGQINIWENLDNKSLGLSDCEDICRKNCSCTAYASFLPDGLGCKFSGGLIVTHAPIKLNEYFYFRGHIEPSKGVNLWFKIFITVVALSFLALVFFMWYLIRKKRSFKGELGSRRTQVGCETEQFMNELGRSMAAIDDNTTHNSMIRGSKDHELPLFSFSSLETATNHFSEANKLGRGGFGPVFKGTLDDGKEIAVKRLSERSGQGTEEFKNEVMLISKVQHRNLVRLYGCCIKGEEKLLIYEYLPNKSLDTFLFDDTRRILLDWKLRMNIIEGIAQGLLYLHKYSRLKIIHRDLKTSNILLDNNMNPKISDFGTAKIFSENESCANTSRIVGTYGYMSPEYAMDGLYSVKSDVYSFGVMILEIISGKKNKGFYQIDDQSPNLVRHAWNLWKEEKTFELMDPILAKPCLKDEFGRFVRIGMLCVQENAADRPTMSDVVLMLGNDTGNLPEPRQSSLSTLLSHNIGDRPNIMGSVSINGITISSIYAR